MAHVLKGSQFTLSTWSFLNTHEWPLRKQLYLHTWNFQVKAFKRYGITERQTQTNETENNNITMLHLQVVMATWHSANCNKQYSAIIQYKECSWARFNVPPIQYKNHCNVLPMRVCSAVLNVLGQYPLVQSCDWVFFWDHNIYRVQSLNESTNESNATIQCVPKTG